jgi:cyclophilin family peptidyl-prolyl cis-trans isomerase
MAMIEGLEGRRLLAASITEITPDNRGEVVIQLSEPVTGVRKSSIRMYTFGTDGVANTADDVRLNTVVNYDNSRRRIVTRVIGNLEANVGYRIRIQARDVRSAIDGSQFDGEYNSNGTSGNGVGNGNYNARFRAYRANEVPRARISSTAGIVDLVLRRDAAPATVTNFLRYADSGRYDGLFVNRNIPGFVVQLGAARVTGDGNDVSDLEAIERFPNVANEFNLSNLRGTVALAKNSLGGSADFFFNLADNSSLDAFRPNNGGQFTVFATVANNSGQSTVDSIAGRAVVALRNEQDQTRTSQSPDGIVGTNEIQGAGLTDVPVNSTTGLTGVSTTVDDGGNVRNLVQAGLVPNRDLVVVRRVALILRTASV